MSLLIANIASFAVIYASEFYVFHFEDEDLRFTLI